MCWYNSLIQQRNQDREAIILSFLKKRNADGNCYFFFIAVRKNRGNSIISKRRGHNISSCVVFIIWLVRVRIYSICFLQCFISWNSIIREVLFFLVSNICSKNASFQFSKLLNFSLTKLSSYQISIQRIHLELKNGVILIWKVESLVELKFDPGFRVIGEYIWFKLTLNVESIWLKYSPITRNLGSNFSSPMQWLNFLGQNNSIFSFS